MIVQQDHIPPIWHPIARFRRWRKRRACAKAIGNFSSYLMPVVQTRFPAEPLGELVSVQRMSESEAAAVFDEHRRRVEPQARAIAEKLSGEALLKWNLVYGRIPWWHKLWRWAKGSNETGCCQ